MKKRRHSHEKRMRRLPAALLMWESEGTAENYPLHARAKVGPLWRSLNGAQLATVVHRPMLWTVVFRAIYMTGLDDVWIESEMAEVRQLQVLNNLEPIAAQLRESVLEGNKSCLIDIGWMAISRVDENQTRDGWERRWLGPGLIAEGGKLVADPATLRLRRSAWIEYHGKELEVAA